MQDDIHRYDDIINLPCPEYENHPRMGRIERAAQFSPFAALTGYDSCITEAARLTDRKPELTDDEKQNIDYTLQLIKDSADHLPVISATYFEQDRLKAGGELISVGGKVSRFSSSSGMIFLENGVSINIGDLVFIEIE